MIKARRWLEERPESTIAVVAHHGVIRGITGADFDNCQMGVAFIGEYSDENNEIDNVNPSQRLKILDEPLC